MKNITDAMLDIKVEVIQIEKAIIDAVTYNDVEALKDVLSNIKTHCNNQVDIIDNVLK